VTTENFDHPNAVERLIAALKELDVRFRVDEDGRILASDGRQEYEVTVDLTRLRENNAVTSPRSSRSSELLPTAIPRRRVPTPVLSVDS
jgi:hypothetical protein